MQSQPKSLGIAMPRLTRSQMGLFALLFALVILTAVMAIQIRRAIITAPVTQLAASPQPARTALFRPVATFRVSGKVAEIVAATPDGKLLVYSDSESQAAGFVDISDPAKPKQEGTLQVKGEPTSVAITPSGKWLLCVVKGTPNHLLVVDMKSRAVVRTLGLGGQPDCVAISPDGRFAAIAIENERPDDKAPMPQNPAGFLTIVNTSGEPANWKLRDVQLTNLSSRFPTDPEPEFIAINSKNEAAVTLQENNHIVIVDIASARVLRHWSAGSTTHDADLKVDGKDDFSDILKDARREPDAIAWTPNGNLITANEGDYDLDLKPSEYSGGRNWTIFSPDGNIVYDDATVEKAVSGVGAYPDKRSDKRGIEPEAAAVARFGKQVLAFIGCERANCVVVYDISNENTPQFLQVLKTGDRPEGVLPISQRSLLVTANEGDGTLSIFAQ